MAGTYRQRFTITCRCDWCCGEFQATRPDARFCCNAHRQRWYRLLKKEGQATIAGTSIKVTKRDQADDTPT